MIRIALPNKGRLAEASLRLLERAGLEFEIRGERALQASLGGNFQALFLRTQDIPEFVADGAADLGITGKDRVLENGRNLELLLDLGFGRCRLVVAGRDDGPPIDDVAEIPEGTSVATSFPNLTRRFFEKQGKTVTLVPVSGAAEIAPHIGVADFIVDLVSTGSTLKINGLKEITTVAESIAVLIGNPKSVAAQAETGSVGELVAALESVIRARDKRYLMANIPRSALEEIRRILPGISGPTIIDIMNSGETVAAHAVVDRRQLYSVIASLKEIGATGILVTKIERLLP